MVYVLLALLAALVACFILNKKHPHLIKPVVFVMAGVTALISVIAAIHYLGNGDEKTEGETLSCDQSVGYMLAEAVAADFPSGGDVIVIPSFADAEQDPGYLGMRKVSEGPALNLNLIIAARPRDGSALGLTGGMLRELADAHPGCVAIVSFLPVLDYLDLRQMGQVPPLYLVIMGRSDQWKMLLARDVMRAAVVGADRVDPAPVPPAGSTPRQVFSMRYRLVRAGDLKEQRK